MTVRTSLQRSLGARRARGADGNRRPQTSEHALLVHALSDEVDVFGITPAGEQRDLREHELQVFEQRLETRIATGRAEQQQARRREQLARLLDEQRVHAAGAGVGAKTGEQRLGAVQVLCRGDAVGDVRTAAYHRVWSWRRAD